MTNEDIIRMAREAGCWSAEIITDKPVIYPVAESLERFANLIAEAEREACAKLCDKQASDLWQKNCDSEGHGADQCATAIRARVQHE
jgi:hypothetical protein